MGLIGLMGLMRPMGLIGLMGLMRPMGQIGMIGVFSLLVWEIGKFVVWSFRIT
jgi:hypothetical protein